MTMTPEEYLKAGQVEPALAALNESVRKAPADPRLRRFLFQLHCVLGRWEKALTQLQVLADLDAESLLLAQIFRPVIACETLRAEVFAGKRTPLIFGEPEEWVSWLVQANTLAAQGEFKAAKDLQGRAFEAAPAAAGQINGFDFTWVADADSRLGPMFEAYIDSKYYWIPGHRVARISLQPPSDLRDLIWAPAQFSWSNGGESTGLMPVRYPGTEASTDDGLRLSRRTEWQEKPEEFFFGLGQRTFSTEGTEYPMLEVRDIQFTTTPAPTEEAAAPAAAS
jgi:type VI secretion system protein ImpE